MIFLLVDTFVLGMATKFADLLDEHGLKWFKGSDLLFGIIWGTLFAIQITNNLFASFYLALLLHWILRGRIDFFNHQIATVIILITSLYVLPSIDWLLFSVSFLTFVIIGLSADNKLMRKTIFTKYNLFVFLVLCLLALSTNPIYWYVLISFFLNSSGYQIVKRFEK